MTGDPHWSKVVLAMHMDGANGSTVFTDQKGNTVTRTGDAKISTAQSKFGGASAFFDGSGDYLTIPNSADFNFGTGDFCIEAFIRLQDVASYKGIFGGNNSGEFAIYSAGNQLEIGRWGVAGIASSGTAVLTAAQWHRVAVSRSEGVVRLFIDGVTVAEVAYTTAVTYAGLLCIGSDAGRSYGMAGYIDDVRITKGVARYTADFTPPVVTFPNGPAMISGTTKDSAGVFAPRAVRVYRKSDGALAGAATSHGTTGAFAVPALDDTAHYAIAHDTDADPYWDKVVLAMHMDGANGSTVFTDLKGGVVTRVGDAQISTAQSRFGGGSLLTSGSSSVVKVSYSAGLEFGAGDFEIEAWVYPTTTAARIILSRRAVESSVATIIYTDASNKLNALVTANGIDWLFGGPLVSSSALIANTWSHIALLRVSGMFVLAVNGVIETRIYSALPLAPSSSGLGVGGDLSGGTSDFLGYINDVRITKGVARYQAAFTPPERAFSGAMTAGTSNALIFDDLTPD